MKMPPLLHQPVAFPSSPLQWPHAFFSLFCFCSCGWVDLWLSSYPFDFLIASEEKVSSYYGSHKDNKQWTVWGCMISITAVVISLIILLYSLSSSLVSYLLSRLLCEVQESIYCLCQHVITTKSILLQFCPFEAGIVIMTWAQETVGCTVVWVGWQTLCWQVGVKAEVAEPSTNPDPVCFVLKPVLSVTKRNHVTKHYNQNLFILFPSWEKNGRLADVIVLLEDVPAAPGVIFHQRHPPGSYFTIQYLKKSN